MTLLRWSEHPAARSELRDAVFWYDDKEPGLGDCFNDEVAEAVDFVREWPESAPLYGGRRRIPDVRRKGVAIFPYGIVYFVRGDELIIAAYAHEKRRPGYWRQRLIGF